MLLLQILSFGGLLKCGLISEWREEKGKEEQEGVETEQGSRITIQEYHNIFTWRRNDSSDHDSITCTVDCIGLD